MSVDVEAIRARARNRRTARVPDRRQGDVETDIQALLWELEETRAEVRRLTQENEDLRGSAEAWIRLYLASLERANGRESAIGRAVGDPAASVQHSTRGSVE
jgi:hypothetical protein